jgi:hypothetical protein
LENYFHELYGADTYVVNMSVENTDAQRKERGDQRKSDSGSHWDFPSLK